jgi:hypothetical protein
MTVSAILEQSRRFFEKTVRAVPESDATLCLTPDSWSVSGIVEHIVMAERALLARFDAAERSETSLCNPARETRIVEKLRDRADRAEAPERAWPAGRFETLNEALGEFLAARDRTIQFAAAHEPQLYYLTVMHPLVGKVNGFEMLLIIAAHSDRHAAQIQEICARGLTP